jgi:hypothetical protein
MSWLKRCAAASLLLMVLVGLSLAKGYYNRQYYSSWNYYPQTNYYYRYYYYKPYDDYCGYKYQYCIYTPDYPDYCYFYNPYKRVYWGRCPCHCNGEGQYSVLAESDRQGDLASIPSSAFPTPGPMPAIPDSKDGAKMDLPPDDLPKAPGQAAPGLPGIKVGGGNK